MGPAQRLPAVIAFLVVFLTIRVESRQKLLVILADGFRYDYVSLDPSLTGFRRMEKDGVHADYVNPIFPSSSYPNWYTIVTGLYSESHGIVGNYMYDPYRKTRFSMDNTPPLDFWWNQAEPIWTTTEKNGLKTAVQWWDGCQIPHSRHILPQICSAYRPPSLWPTLVNDTEKVLMDSLDRFHKNETQMELVYYEKVDYEGHHSGPNSTNRYNAVKSLDRMINNILDRINDMRLQDHVNLVILSDHGMTDTRNYKMIDLSNAFDPKDVLHIVQQTGHVIIEPVPGAEVKMYDSLRRGNVAGITLYTKESIPEEYHIKNSNRTFKFLLVAKPEYFFYTKNVFEPNPPGLVGQVSIGAHGFDPYDYANRDMRTIFYATGPAFKRGVKVSPMEMVDHYNVFCHVMNIQGNPNNGSLTRIKDMLVVPPAVPASQSGKDGGGAAALGASLGVLCLATIVIVSNINKV